MAIDTAPKRLSMLDFGGESTVPGIPAPDASINSADRLHLLWLYSGIAAGGGGVVVQVAIYHPTFRSRRR